MLCNRRYAREIEINKANKGVEELSENDAYRIVKTPPPPIVPLEIFEIAQRIRSEKANLYPNHRGKARNYSKRQPDHLYLLQGLLVCAHCGHPMSSHYVFHKVGYGRRQESFLCHSVCARYKKYGKDCDHANRILARKAESWMADRMGALLHDPIVIERALEKARENSFASVLPQREALGRTQAALRENQQEIDKLVAAMTGGGAAEALLGILNQRAKELKIDRENLLAEQRRLQQELAPAEQVVDAQALAAICRTSKPWRKRRSRRSRRNCKR